MIQMVRLNTTVNDCENCYNISSHQKTWTSKSNWLDNEESTFHNVCFKAAFIAYKRALWNVAIVVVHHYSLIKTIKLVSFIATTKNPK